MWAQIYIFEKEWQFSGRRIRRLTTVGCVVCKFNEEWRDQNIAIQLEYNWSETLGKYPRSFYLERQLPLIKNTHSPRTVKCGSTKRFALAQMQHFHTFWRFFCFIFLHFWSSYCVKRLLSLKSVFSVFSDPCLLLCTQRMKCHWKHY